VKFKIMKQFGLESGLFHTVASAVGLISRRQGKRHFAYVYPSGLRAQCVKLRE